MTLTTLLATFESLHNPRNVAGMARYAIRAEKAYGIPAPVLRGLAKEIGADHALAHELWKTGIHDARILAALIADPACVTERDMERWVKAFDNWAVCDTFCMALFDKTPFAWEKASAWSGREEEFVKRAGFALMATLAVHDKKAPDERFLPFLSIIEREAHDGRNFVKKAVNWALRQIGKRNLAMNKHATAAARRIHAQGSPPARWIARDALRELESDAVQERLKKKSTKPHPQPLS